MCWINNAEFFSDINGGEVLEFGSFNPVFLGQGWGMAPITASGTNRYEFAISVSGSGPSSFLTSSATFPTSTWTHHTVRYTDSSNLMEQFVDGLLDANTATRASPGSPGNPSNLFHLGQSSASRGISGFLDECAVFAGKMDGADVLRVEVCGIDGVQCQCDWAGDPTTYTSRPRYSSGTMPACNASGPS